ncbi:MAG: OsmC family protein [Sphingobacteriales bacterium]|nr:MAG: OsmC family protein [Sphingobacteriales bacterium]
MQVEMSRIDSDFHFQAKGSSGVLVNIDASSNIGGHEAGARPMELILMGLAGCSAIDVIQILRKQKLEMEDIDIKVKAERVPDEIPSVFKKIHVHFVIKGELPLNKVSRAIALSIDKYCSVTAMLRHSVEITHSFEVIP